MPELSLPQRRWLAVALAALVLFHLAPRALVDVWQQRPFGVVFALDGGVRLRDFTSHARMARLALEGRCVDRSGEGASLYSPRAHLEMTSEWTGRPAARALPFGYSPTMVWVLA